MWSQAVPILWSTFSSINSCSVSLCCCNQGVLDLHYDALYLCEGLCVCIFSSSLLQITGAEKVRPHPRTDWDTWLSIPDNQGSMGSSCPSSSPAHPRQKLILFAELFGKASMSAWVCSIWCLTCCAFRFSLLCHLNSSLFCDFFLKKDWCFWRLVK